MNCKNGFWHIFKVLVVLNLLCAFLSGCNQVPEEIDYQIIQLKLEDDKKTNDYSRLFRDSESILEVKVLDKLSALNSEVITNEDGEITDFSSFRKVVVTKVIKGNQELLGQEILLREPIAIRSSNGYEYFKGQLETALVEGLSYLVYLDKKDARDFYPVANNGYAKWALNGSLLTDDWILLTLLNDYGQMNPRKYVLRGEESFEYEEFESIHIHSVEKDNYILYFYDVRTGRTYFTIDGRYYSVSGKIAFPEEEQE